MSMQNNSAVMSQTRGTPDARKPMIYGIASRLCSTARFFGGTFARDFPGILSVTRSDASSVPTSMSHGAETGLPHINRYPGNAVPIATRPEMESTSTSGQGTRVDLLGYQEEKGPWAESNKFDTFWERRMSTKLVIKVSEARAILAMGNALDAPSIETNREKNLIYYTGDPREMELWRAGLSRTSGAKDGI